MFSRFNYISRFVLQYKNNVSYISLRNFVKGGSKPNRKVLNMRDIRAKGKKESKEGNGSQSNNNIPQNELGHLEIYAIIFSGAIITYGITGLLSNVNRLKGQKAVTQKEFEMEYLLNGEVNGIFIPGFLTSYLSDVQGEARLYPDEQGKIQTISIKSISKEAIINLIQNTETELKIGRNEAVKYNLDVHEGCLVFGGFLAQIIILRKITKHSSFSKPPFSQDPSKLTNRSFIFEFPNRDKINEDMKRKMGSTRPLPKFEEKQKFKDLFSDFFTDNTVEEYHEKTDIKFKDVAGLHSAKQEVKEFLDYLSNPARFIRLGAKLPRGAMLLGPPGCGKTLLIKALANESNVPFFYKAGSDFVEMIGGVGAQKLRKLFKEARKNAPAIIFLDEIDAIGKKRGQDQQGGDADQTLNQLLVEMDGMDPNAGIVVFAATNRADVLDQALIRPGRLDRHISIDLPVLEERKEIFNLYLNKLKDKLDSKVSTLIDKLALQTPGMTGADIANLCNEAALTAAKLNYITIKDDCFDLALERIIAGAAKKSRILNEKERTIVAYHEAGHVLVGWLLKYADPILKVSIVPRTNAALGFAQVNPTEKYLLTSEMLIDKITVLLGGRAAESIIFNRVTSGAHDDLRKVKKIAFSMIRELGMSEKIGHLSFQVTEEDESMGSYPYSQNTREIIDSEANLIVASAYKRAESVLRSNRDKLELIAKELLAKEVLKNVDIQALIGARPFDLIK